MEWQSKKLRDNNVVLLKASLSQLFGEEAGVEAYQECVSEFAGSVPDEEIIKVIWTSMVGSLNTVGKNQMQMLQMIIKQVKLNKPLFEAYTNSMKRELALLNCLQVTCYEDSKLLKVCISGFQSTAFKSRVPFAALCVSSLRSRQCFAAVVPAWTCSAYTIASCRYATHRDVCLLGARALRSCGCRRWRRIHRQCVVHLLWLVMLIVHAMESPIPCNELLRVHCVLYPPLHGRRCIACHQQVCYYIACGAAWCKPTKRV